MNKFCLIDIKRQDECTNFREKDKNDLAINIYNEHIRYNII